MNRVLAIGDIHGCYRSLDALLAAVQPDQRDTVITLGDYVDRGPDSREVINCLIKLSQATSLVSLRGNHEAMMLAAHRGIDFARRWMLSGGDDTLDSYDGLKGAVAQLEDLPEDHWRFLNDLRLYWETDDAIFVHGCVDPALPMVQQEVDTLLWSSFSGLTSKHCSGKRVICGHEVQRSGVPANNDYGTCIDTGAWRKGWLTCVQIDTMTFWQANENQTTRRFTSDTIPT
ncbi:MAG: metallophosphoesterase family protein [Planctomycetota bacterium]